MRRERYDTTNNCIKRHTGVKLAAGAGVSVLTLALVGNHLWQSMRPVEVDAQESFSGIRKVVESYDEENPFVILDIVPGMAFYSYQGTHSVEIPLGTIGYLTGGESPMQQSLAKVFKEKQDDFYAYADREALAEAIASMAAGVSTLSYEEGYGGITPNLSEAYGWTQIYDSVLDGPENQHNTLKQQGRIYGTAIPYQGGADGDRTGYDYNLISGTVTLDTADSENGIYTAAEGNGTHFATFSYAGEATEGYIIVSVSADLRAYSGTTGVYYRNEDGTYSYCGQIKNIFSGGTGETSSGSGNEGGRPSAGDGSGAGNAPSGSETEGKNPSGDGNGDSTEGGGTSEGESENSGTSEGDGSISGDGTEVGNPSGNGNGDSTEGGGTSEGGSENGGTSEGSGSSSEGNGNESDEMIRAVRTDASGYARDVARCERTAGHTWQKFLAQDAASGTEIGADLTNSAGPEAGAGSAGSAETEPGTGAAGSTGAGAEAGTGAADSIGAEEGTGADASGGIGAGAPTTGYTGIPEGESTDGYYVLTFAYVSNLDAPVGLYQVNIDTVRPVGEVTVDGMVPYDTYNLENPGIAGEEETADAENENLLQTFAQTNASADAQFIYAGKEKGDYKLVAIEGGAAFDLYNAPVFFRFGQSRDYLKEYVFQSLSGGENASTTFDIRVETVRADQVTIDDVMNADLIYVEDGKAVTAGSGTVIQFIDPGNDMAASVLLQIVNRAANDLLPVMVDYGVVVNLDDYAGTNYQKLAKILLKKDLGAYVQDMGSVENMLMNPTPSEYPDKTDNAYHYVNRNIYVMNEVLLGEYMNESFSSEEAQAGFREVLAAITVENETLASGNKLSESISKAKVIQYIINYSFGLISDYRDFRVLELQPTTNGQSDLKQRDDSEKNNTILYWQRADSSAGKQILRSTKQITIGIDTKSIAEFAGVQADINDAYQMIFIGLDGQRLNYANRETAYNDSAMNGIVYSNLGDVVTVGGERYDSIDITAQKKEALLDFMRAGYPIVVEDDFFIEKTAREVGESAINTKYVASSSQMYDFLRTAVTQDSYRRAIYTISDVHSSALFAMQINAKRPQIVRLDPNGSIAQDLSMQRVSADREGKYQGQVAYVVTDDTGGVYPNNVAMRFYLDLNQDGRFATDEEIDNFSAVGGQLIVNFETPERGIVPWKLEVTDAENAYRRDAMTGYFDIVYPNRTQIHVLQVVADGEMDEAHDGAFNLELTYEQTNTMLGHFLRDAEGIIGSDFSIETLTVSEFTDRLATNPQCLMGVDVLVLGFGPAYHLGAAAEEVNRYIESGKGVLLSSNAAMEETGQMGITPVLMGLSDTKTYSKLGSMKGTGGYYQYSSLKNDMFGKQGGLSANQINDGAVSHYPFEVGSRVTISQSVVGADYILNMTANGTQNAEADVTAWYCLGDSSVLDIFTAYDVSRQDAKNNYYIYSKGNVVYVGQDSYPFSYEYPAGVVPDSTDKGVAECRLFVNALMEAYNVGIKNPQVAIVAGLAEDSSEIESICIPFDEQIREDDAAQDGLLDEWTDVYFKVAEPNLAFYKEVRIAFYYQDDAGGPVDIGGSVVNATSFGSTVWTVENNQLSEVPVEAVSVPGLEGFGKMPFVPGKVYKIKAPVIPLQDGSSNADIYIVVQSSFHKLGQDRSAIGSDSVTLNRAQLFLLE